MWKDGIRGNEALNIISSNDEKLCVIAGPGTGKTFALKKRIEKLLEEGKDPSRMLVVTFSRIAALDIKKELLESGFKGSEKIRAQTLHSFCFSILHKEGVIQSTGRDPRILLDYEKKFMLNDLLNLHLGSVSFYCMKHSINLFNKQDGLTIHWAWFYRFVFGVYYNTLLQRTSIERVYPIDTCIDQFFNRLRA